MRNRRLCCLLYRAGHFLPTMLTKIGYFLRHEYLSAYNNITLLRIPVCCRNSRKHSGMLPTLRSLSLIN